MKKLLSVAIATALLASGYALPLEELYETTRRQVQNELPNAVPVLVAGDLTPNGVELVPALEPVVGSDDLSEGVLRRAAQSRRRIAAGPFDDGVEGEDNMRDISNLLDLQAYSPRTPEAEEIESKRSNTNRRRLAAGSEDASDVFNLPLLSAHEPNSLLLGRAAQAPDQSPAEAPRDPAPIDPPPQNGLPAEPEQQQEPEEDSPEPDTSDEESESLHQEQLLRQQEQPQQSSQESQAQQQLPQRRSADDPDDEEEPVPLPI